MNTLAVNPYKRHRFPAQIIGHGVWLYFRVCPSDVEEMMAERGIRLTYASLCYWCRTFGQQYANQLRQRERQMQGFKSPGQAQRFLSAYGLIASHFRPRRHHPPAGKYHQERRQRFQTWREISGVAQAA